MIRSRIFRQSVITVLAVIFTAAFAGNALAELKLTWDIGAKLGSGVSGDQKTDAFLGEERTGFGFGFFVTSHVSKNLGLRLEGLFSRRGVQGDIGNVVQSPNTFGEVILDYFDVAVLAQTAFKLDDRLRLQVFGGPYGAINMGTTLRRGKSDFPIDNLIRNKDYGVIAGLGLEYAVGDLTFMGEARATRGLASIGAPSAGLDIKLTSYTLMAGVSIPLGKLSDMGAIKDFDLGEQEVLWDKYVGKNAWTRTTIEDLTERQVPGEPKKKIVPRDSKIQIVDVNVSYNGSVTVLDHDTFVGNLPERKKIVHGLDIDRPITVDKFDERMAEIFWFKSPTLRHVDYIRMWGKKTARAVRNHEVFVGMPGEAALESWGIPTKVRTNEIGGKNEQQWAYREPKRTKYVYIIDNVVTKWEE